MTKHSPAPWNAECVGTSSVGPDGVDIYEINNGYLRIAEHVFEADARLIAAAPELVDLARNVAGFDDGLLLTPDLNVLRATMREWRDQARAAIRKAEG